MRKSKTGGGTPFISTGGDADPVIPPRAGEFLARESAYTAPGIPERMVLEQVTATF